MNIEPDVNDTTANTRLRCMKLGIGLSGATLVTCILRDGRPVLRRTCGLVLARGGGWTVVTAVAAVARCPVLLGAFARVLVCLVVPNDTSHTSAQQSMVARKVTGCATDRGTL